MANKKAKKRKGGSKRAKITIKEKAQIIQKNDKIKVQQPDTLRKAKVRPPASVAPVFRVKIRKKQ